MSLELPTSSPILEYIKAEWNREFDLLEELDFDETNLKESKKKLDRFSPYVVQGFYELNKDLLNMVGAEKLAITPNMPVEVLISKIQDLGRFLSELWLVHARGRIEKSAQAEKEASSDSYDHHTNKSSRFYELLRQFNQMESFSIEYMTSHVAMPYVLSTYEQVKKDGSQKGVVAMGGIMEVIE